MPKGFGPHCVVVHGHVLIFQAHSPLLSRPQNGPATVELPGHR
jgi:hypothetical protein